MPETTVDTAVALELDRDLANELVSFALAQGLMFDDAATTTDRVIDSINFALGVAVGLSMLSDVGLLGPQACRVCGCTDMRACVRQHPGGLHEHASGARYDVCRWTEADLCSACADGAAPDWLHPDDQAELAVA